MLTEEDGVWWDESFTVRRNLYSSSTGNGKRKGTALLCTRVNKTRTFSGFVFVHLIVQKTLKVYVMRSTKGNACKKTCRLEHLKNKLDKALTKSYAVKCYAGTPQMT